MAYNPDAPIFADRYRFEPVKNDWDRGRSSTGLVYDLKERRLGVIKRTETISKPQTHSLQNEIKALIALKGLGVPEVYDTDQAVYDSKNYDYAVIEYLDGIRVEKSLDSLSIVERADIITQLFGLLSQAHQKGIVNGDVDLKHLFWRKDKKQLIVIDWGNAKLGVDPKKKTEFAYDLARAAEIIFSLVARQGHPAATGSIALPNASALVAGLEVLPVEFQNLCKWAPRTPDGTQAPYTAKELFDVSKKWFEAISSSKPYRPNSLTFKRSWLVVIPLLGLICVALLVIIKPFGLLNASVTPTNILTLTETMLPTITPTVTLTSTVAPTVTFTSTPAEPTLIPTEIPISLPPPLEYTPIVVFDDQPLAPEYKLCWTNEVEPVSDLVNPEGFNRKSDNTWWVFNTGDVRTTEESVMADFGTCPNDMVYGEVVDIPKLNKTVKAIALNTWISQIQPENDITPGGEFGIFLRDTDGITREYMFWVDQSDTLHLRIREDSKIIYDDTVLGPNIQSSGRGNIYRQFRMQIFLEVDNNGSTIVYLLEADPSSANAQDLNPNQMVRIDAATLPTMGDLKGFGLTGRGGSTLVTIWPLALLGK